MIDLKRPLGLLPLLMVVSTLVILTAMLGTMVWSRVSLLQNGLEITLKTAPVDPRDLLRGYFVRLNYDISRINHDELLRPMSQRELAGGFKKRSRIFVELRPDADGFWSPVSLHRTMPKSLSEEQQNPRAVFIRGRVTYGSCRIISRKPGKCNVSIRYGIEKFFAEKKRARKLEDFGRQVSPELTQLRKRLRKMEQKYRKLIRQSGKSNTPDAKELQQKLKELRRQQGVLVQQNRIEMTKRFAIIVRVDKRSGEAAISGLQLDGQPIYEERLF